MFNILRGLIAGFVATVVISILMAIAHVVGLIPELSIMPLLDSDVKNPVGIPLLPIMGWVIYFMIATLLWSIIFALLAGKGSTYSPFTHALFLSLALWVILMAVLMPIAGHGVFGLATGIVVPISTLVLHAIWAWMLAFLYNLLPSAS